MKKEKFMKRLLTFILSLAVSTGSMAASGFGVQIVSAATVDPAILSVRVVDEDGNSVQGIRLQLKPVKTQQLFSFGKATDQKGEAEYAVSGDEDDFDDYQLIPDPESGYTCDNPAVVTFDPSNQEVLSVNKKQYNSAVELVVKKVQGGVPSPAIDKTKLNVKVVDQDGNPVKGADLWLQSVEYPSVAQAQQYFNALTKDDGRTVFDTAENKQMLSGSYLLKLGEKKEDYVQDEVEVVFSDSANGLEVESVAGKEYKGEYELRVRKVEGADKAKQIEIKVGFLPDPKDLSEADIETVEELKAKYDALTNEQKTLVKNSDKLTKAVERIQIIKVDKAIKELPEPDKIRLQDKDAVDKVLSAYDKLSDKQKEELKNTTNLRLAVTTIYKLEAEKKASDAVKERDKLAKELVKLLKPYALKSRAKKTTASISWKMSKAIGLDGYNVYYKVSGKKNAKNKTINTKKTKISVKKLKKGKTYIFNVKGYKKVLGKKVYTKSSNKIKVKIK